MDIDGKREKKHWKFVRKINARTASDRLGYRFSREWFCNIDTEAVVSDEMVMRVLTPVLDMIRRGEVDNVWETAG